jgi:hypothetical protein
MEERFESIFHAHSYGYRLMGIPSKQGGMFLGYGNEISKKSYSKIVGTIRETHFDQWAKSWDNIVKLLNVKIRDWVQYYT